jgi:hypothetical protein
MTDMWDLQEGYISQGLKISFVTLGTVVIAGDPIRFMTSTNNKVDAIVMAKNATIGDSTAVALKGGNTGDVIPVAFHGVMKMCSLSGSLLPGDVVMNAITYGATGPSYGNILAIPTVTAASAGIFRAVSYTGTYNRLGMLLQAATAGGDTALVLLGHLP